MLSLGTHLPKFYILREDLYDSSNEYFCINIGNVRKELSNILKWNSGLNFDPKTSIDDFIFLCFTVGNDFLPHIPMIEIIENGIETIIDVYKIVGESYVHITEKKDNNIKFIKESFKAFLNIIGQSEEKLIQNKLNNKKSYFPDILVEEVSKQNQKGEWEVDINKYRTKYCEEKFPNTNLEKICHEYFEGMQWVITYYTKGVPNWKWKFMNHYAPPSSILAKYIDSFSFPCFGNSIPSTPFQQLLSVLPPKCAYLIPKPLCNLLTDKNSPLKQFCPDNIKVDMAGKKNDWEGIVLLPMIDFDLVRKEYFKLIEYVDEKELSRNKLGSTFVYNWVPNKTIFKSYYGDIRNCYTKIKFIEL